ncbi:hypothetical protein GGI42DRAFT_367913 [Trichoderma sp. SZMC 28013]
MTDWIVETYAVNVGLGDGTIYLLVKVENNARSIESAVLIDGGTDKGAIHLQTAINDIDKMYYPNNNGHLRFNAIVVTHWDEDHYRGVEALIRSHISNNMSSCDIMYPYPQPDDQSTPRTTFYCSKLGFNGKGVSLKPNSTTAIMGNVRYQYMAGIKTDPLCYFKKGDTCLGIDLFSGKQIAQAQIGQTIPNIIENGDIQPANRPRLLVVGIDKELINKVKYEKRQGGTEENASSMMCLLFTPVEARDHAMLDLYAGGDAEDEQEQILCNFLHDSEIVKLQVIKAGHHGSKYATTERFWDLEPEMFLISAAEDYGHPSFSLLFYIMAYFDTWAQRKDRLYCTRFPYWMTKRAGDALINTKDLDITSVLDEAVTQLRGAIEGHTWDGVIEAWFPGATQAITDAYGIMSADHLAEFKRRRKANNISDANMDDQINKGGEQLVKAWGTIQNQAIEQMISQWPAFGNPKFPHFKFSDTEFHTETAYIRMRFYKDEEPTAEVITFLQAQESNAFKTRFVDGRVAPDPAILKDVVDKLAHRIANPQQVQQFSLAATQTQAALNNMGTQPGGVSFMMMEATSKWDSQLFTEDPKAAAANNFFANGLPTEGLEPGASKSFQIESSTNNLKWLKESFGATEAEFQFFKNMSEVLIPAEALITLSNGTRGLRFSSRSDDVKVQFGNGASERTRSDGYNRDIEGIILALTGSDKLKIGIGEFLKTLAPESNFSPWLSPILDLGGELLEFAEDPGHPKKNGLWIHPQLNNRVILRLETQLQRAAVEKMEEFFKNHVGEIKFGQMRIIGVSTAICSSLPPAVKKQQRLKEEGYKLDRTWKFTLVGEVTVGLSPDPTTFITSISNESFTFTLRLAKGTTVTDAVKWIAERFKDNNGDGQENAAEKSVSDLKSVLENIGSSILPRQVSITVGQKGLLAFQIDIEIPSTLGAEPGNHVSFHGQLLWTPSNTKVVAEIWNSGREPLIGGDLNPYFDEYELLKPDDASGLQDHISISHLLDRTNPVKLPKGLPDRIERAGIEISVGKISSLHLSTKLACSMSTPQNDQEVPPLMLQEVLFVYDHFFDKNTEKKLYFRAVVGLEPPPYMTGFRAHANIGVSVLYNSMDGKSNWTLEASATGLEVAHLYTMLPRDGSNHAIMNFMSGIKISEISATYEYNSAGLPSKLTIGGELQIGPVQLKLDYWHAGSEWHFGANVTAGPEYKDKKTSIKELLSDLINVETMESVPEFIQDFQIPLEKLMVDLQCFKASVGGGATAVNYVVFVFEVTLGDFSITFAQLQERSGAFPKGSKKSKPKRFLRMSLSAFPKVDIPIVHELPKPYDALEFLWVSEGITIDEVVLVNTHAFKDKPQLCYQEQAKREGSTVALTAGCHFQIILNEQNAPKCILDYGFNGAKSQKSAGHTATPAAGADIKAAKALPGADQAGGTKSAPLTRSAKGLTIRNISLKMKDKGTLSITLDALVALGPLAFNLIGFSVKLDLSSFKGIDSLANIKASFDLSGMAVAFSRPPATLAGMFVHEDLGNGLSRYMGGLAVGMGVWEFLAAGVYEEKEGYNSVFVFAKLNGPLISFGFAEINGIVGGFGYNSSIRFPSETEVNDFPFVQINTGKKDAAGDIMKQFEALTSKESGGWFSAKKDSYWLAAGLGVKAFQMLDIQAVMVLDLSPNPKFGIFAEAVARVPKGADEENAFLFTDLTIAATFDPSVGILKVAGALTPRSYILHKSCKLTGGFVLAYYFPASGHDGDWVFSLGGYHPSFRVPDHYPPAPPRLGISWIYNDEISITGEAYFAITPQACMGGGRLDLAYRSGRTRAGFSAYADFLIYYDPFQFEARVGVSVYVSSVIGWGILSKEISLEVSADVDLYGPPLAGVAHIHVWFIDFSVHFGPSKRTSPKLDWGKFHKLFNPALDQGGDEHIVSILKGRITTRHDPKIDSPTGGASAASQSAQSVFVRGTQLELQVELRFPISTLVINKNSQDVAGVAGRVNSTPMQINQGFNKSELDITIDLLVVDKREKVNMDIEHLVKNVPGALWNPFDENRSMLDQPNTQSHLMGIKLKAPKAEISKESLPEINTEKFDCKPIDGGRHKFPKVAIVDPKSVPEASTGVDFAQVTTDILDQWEDLRRRFTGGGLAVN